MLLIPFVESSIFWGKSFYNDLNGDCYYGEELFDYLSLNISDNVSPSSIKKLIGD
jgi:hypothetical protein